MLRRRHRTVLIMVVAFLVPALGATTTWAMKRSPTIESMGAANRLVTVKDVRPVLTPSAAATPKATPAATPKATPAATPKATPAATPKATPSATPKATPSATPKATIAAMGTTTANNVTCTYPRGLAKGTTVTRELQAKIWAAVSSNTARMGVSVYDWNTNVWCSYGGARTFDSASIIKATTLATLLWQRQQGGRPLTATEQSWATAAITESDNTAESSLWADVGYGAGVSTFLKAAGMTQTTIESESEGYWGLTQVTAYDQVVLLRVLADPGLLSVASRNYELTLMRSVEDDQRWGVSDGAPSGATVANKNGWLPGGAAVWTINSIGLITGSGHKYAIAVLSDINPSMSVGVERVEEVSDAINDALT
jgi:beta-lactamase class A